VSRWKVVPSAKDLIVREKDYVAAFECHNVDTGTAVHIEFNQQIGGPVADLIGALRALAKTLLLAASTDTPSPKGADKLN
jgi:hypothetical protein